ncbi:MAG: NADH-quinone oxidoreductase subunit NuoF [Sulfuricurvum sp.]|jgi:NADH-quinone oxidoreductase subunit F|uniref:NADH-quinone oxidoreductase subunit NuoF n=1 Tax=Sulfuricurvum sp. TaxID=2025608 RepID=UPI0025EBB36C|nr:NADH-quinone oxidoreductase subunit NuoF [Sulfuricurvum sp.]MCK9371813.1 NADH-quinone oxidoreductase subunit NuoF [Sulfuricurvum sp.]
MIQRIVSRKFDIPDAHRIDVALLHGGYATLSKAFAMEPDAITTEIERSGLRGKGGGGAPTGKKWRLMPKTISPSYLVVNADESEPGTFKDRQILQYDPHLLIEGIIVSAYAMGADHAYVYIRGEYKAFHDRLVEAVEEAYERGYLGENIRNSGFNLSLSVHRGAGAYICGEKSALLESLEGKRGHPRLKPAKPECEWYFGHPATVNNVETIATVPFIVQEGFEAYRAYGTDQSPGTMLFAMSGHISRPGVYELPFGLRMMEVIDELGGGVKNGKKLKAVIPGGASTPVLTAEEAEKATLDYETLSAMGSGLGTGGMIIMDEESCMVKALHNLLSFYRHESCGQCTPCREGTGWVDTLIRHILAGRGDETHIQTLLDVSKTMNGQTICVFAPAVSGVINAFVKKFRPEFEHYFQRSEG